VPRRRALTDRQIASLPRKERRYAIADITTPGLWLRVPVHGPVTFAAVARRRKGVEGGRLVWKTLGTSAFLGVDEARALCRDAIKRIRLGQPLEEAQRDTVADVCNLWLQIVVKGKGYRTARERERIIRKYIVPSLGDRPFVAVRRSEIAAMLDAIAEHNGIAQADMVLKIFGAVVSWWSKRDDDYHSPIVRGMKRGEATNRERILKDDEIRAVWHTAERFGAAGGFVQFALLSAQRHAKITDMRWGDLDGVGVWTIRADVREKGNANHLALPQLALEIIQRQPRIAGKDRIFGRPHARTLAQLRKEAGVTDFVVHDLRRTARSLMSRAQVSSDVAELILGHRLRGVRQVYDRHSYFEEKQRALNALARLIENILQPPAGNVVSFGATS
jgi:integrase